MHLQQRSLNSELLLQGMDSMEIIEAYPDDKYLPSFLLRWEYEGRVLHAQVATDIEGNNIRVVTIYAPAVGEWISEFRVRRTPE